MYLFDKKGNVVNVYNLVANSQAIKDYKEKELCAMDDYNMVVYCAKTNSEPILEVNDVVTNNDLNYNIAGDYHSFYYDCHKPEIIRYFVDGSFNNKRIVQVLDNNGDVIRYLLLTQSYSDLFGVSKKEKAMFNILSIPRSLYLLQMLQQGKFEVLNGINIDEQLKLFELTQEPIDSFTYNEFSYMDTNKMDIIDSSKVILERKLNLDSKTTKKK